MMNYRGFFDNAFSEAFDKAPFSDDEEFVNIVKERTRTMEKKKFRMKKPAVIAIAAAAAAALTISVGAVSFTLLPDLFTKYFGDSATKQLADEGYIYTAEDYVQNTAADTSKKLYPVMGETLEKDIFTAKVLGIAGDTQNPMMLADITVNDPDVASASDIIGVYTLAVGTEEFETRRENYVLEYSKGVKDEEDPSLFHVSARVPPLWVTGGEEVVFDIVSIHTEGNNKSNDSWDSFYLQELTDFGISAGEANSKLSVHNVEMQFRFTIPENVLKESIEKDYNELEYNVNGTKYRLHYAQFGAHTTIIRFDYDDSDYDYNVNPEADSKAAEQFTLTVDGVTYTPNIPDTGSFVDDTGFCNLGIKGLCYMSLEFPAIDSEHAQSITLSANGVIYDITPVGNAG